MTERDQWGLWELLESVEIWLHQTGQAGSTDRGESSACGWELDGKRVACVSALTVPSV